MGRHAAWRKRRYTGLPEKHRKVELERAKDASRCAKKAYASKQEARVALANLRALRRKQERVGDPRKIEGKGERSWYRCPECRLWHLTSWARVRRSVE